jgi:hypothetical protein
VHEAGLLALPPADDAVEAALLGQAQQAQRVGEARGRSRR